MIFLVILVVIETFIIIYLYNQVKDINECIDVLNKYEKSQNDINARMIHILNVLLGEKNADSCNESNKI